MTFRAEPVTDGNAALITALDRTLTWLRPHDAKRADALIKNVLEAFSTADGAKRLEGIAEFTDVVLELLHLAQTNGSLTGLSALGDGAPQEITKFFADVCVEMEEILMAFVSACDDEIEALNKLLIKIRGGADFADVRLKTLMFAFNTHPNTSVAKPQLFLNVVEFAASVNLLELAVLPVLKKCIDWPMSWQCSADTRRQIYSSVATYLEKLDQPSLTYQWRCKAVQLSDGSTPESINEAASCLQMAISLATEFYFDTIMNYKAVAMLKDHKSFGALWHVGNILLRGSVQDMTEAFNTHATLKSEFKLDEAACKRKISIIAVASAAHKLHREKNSLLCYKRVIKLCDMAEMVGFSIEETEEACVSGVGHKLFAAKLDQRDKTIEIDHAMCREFVKDDWVMLRERLLKWQQGLQDMHKLLVAPRVPATASA